MSRRSGTTMLVLTISTLVLADARSVRATTIIYGEGNRPTLFQGLVYDGVAYDVSVVWNTNYDQAYVQRTPWFFGDGTAAAAARDSLSQALVADGYTSAVAQSYLAIPYEYVDPVMRHLCIGLQGGPTSYTEISMPLTQVTAEMCFTLWDQATADETMTWAGAKALFR